MRFGAPMAFALSLVSAAATAQSAKTTRVSVDTQHITTGGATFTVPAGWSIESKPQFLVATTPEADSHIALIELQAKDADAAVAAAWALYLPGEHRALRVTEKRSPRSGWVERRYYEYETSPNEKAVVYALAWRAGRRWTVSILHANAATYGKRVAGFSLLFTSLRAKGYRRENFAGKKAHSLDTARIAQMRRFVEESMRELVIPGAAISLIDSGKVVFLQGFGVRELGKPSPVDADTLFMAASNTKALTTLLLAELVDEHQLRWDEPVIDVYRAFKLGNPQTTRQVLIKHLVCACTGMPQQNLEWLFNYRIATPASSLALLATTQPTSGFGEIYQYSNLMAAAGGYVAAYTINPTQELGATYDEAMHRKVFAPLRMDRTTFDFATALKGDFASPHGEGIDGRTAVARMDINYAVAPVRPAGGVWTSARDLSQYVEMELAEGLLPDGKRLVSKQNLLARREPQIATGEDESYGMGLVINRKYGIPVIDHGGSQFGYKSDMIFLPEQDVGAVILTNADAGIELRGPFLRRLVEVIFDAKPEAKRQLAVAAAERNAEIAKDHAGLAIHPDPAAVTNLARHYTSSALGELAVRSDSNGTVFDFGEWHSSVASRTNADRTISFVTVDPTIDGYDFVVGKQQGRRTLTIHDAQHEYVFVESPVP